MLGTKTVLAVEPDPGLRDFIKRALELVLGVRVVGVGDGREAARIARELRPDLVIVEVRASPQGGLDAARQLKDDPVGHDTPVVALVFSDEGRAAALRAGCDDHLTLPFQLDDLVRTIQRHLGGRRELPQAA